MKVGLLVSRTIGALPDEGMFQGYDRVVVMAPVASLPADGRFTRLPDTALEEDYALFDEWATRLADALRRDGRSLPIREREYYRIAIQDFFQEHFENTWTSASRFLQGLEKKKVRSIVVMGEDPILRDCLAAWGHANGMDCVSVESGPWVPEGGSVGRGEGTSQFRTNCHRLVPSWNASVSRWLGIFSHGLRCHGKLIVACLAHQVHYQIFDYALREMRRRGYEVVLVDIRRWKGERVLSSPNYPYLHLWSLPALLSFRVWNKQSPPSLVRHEIEDLPVANAATLEALASSIEYAATFHARCRAASLSLWRRLKPQAILMMGEGAEHACMAAVAAERGIATINLAHAIQLPHWRSYAYDALAVFGPDNVNAHTRREPPPDSCEVVAVGACRYDKIFHRDFPDAKSIGVELKLPKGRAVIMFASTDSQGNAKDMIFKAKVARWLGEAMPQDAILVLKKHHFESDSICEEILGKALGERLRVTRHGNIYGLLNISSAVVVMWSNTGLEAALMNKPVIAVAGESTCPLPYMTYGLCRFAHSADEMRVELDQALKLGVGTIPDYEERRRQFIADILTAHDGRSSVRLADLIERKVAARIAPR